MQVCWFDDAIPITHGQGEGNQCVMQGDHSSLLEHGIYTAFRSQIHIHFRWVHIQYTLPAVQVKNNNNVQCLFSRCNDKTRLENVSKNQSSLEPSQPSPQQYIAIT